MADIFEEIDEDLRREKWERLWSRYSLHVYIAAAAIVGLTALFVVWRDHEQQERQALGARYGAALAVAQDKPEAAIPQFEVLAGGGTSGYPLLARLQAALLKAKTADKAAAGLAALGAIAADDRVEPAFRGLASLLAAEYGFDTVPSAELIARLQPMTAAGDPWRFSALEITALAEFKQGHEDAALKIYRQLADDTSAPATLRARAAEIVGAYRHQG